MKQSLLVTTAVAVLIGTGALAQSPNERAQSPKERSPAPSATQSQPNASSPAAQAPAPSSAGSAANSQNAQSPATNRQDTTTGQSAQNPNANSDAQRPSAQSGQSPSSRSDNNATAAPSQAQSAQPPASSQTQSNTNTSSPANSQNQPAANSANNANPNTNAAPANQPANNQANTAQPSSSNVSISANLNDNQRTRISESITRLNARPVTNVNFSLSVGTVVPRDVHFQPLPADIVEIVPQYRGYNFVVVRDDIVIVEPSTYKIVDVLPRSGRSAAQAPASQPTAAAAPSRKSSFSDNDREVIRKHARSSRTEERRTTGSATSTTRVRVGDRLPDSVEIRSFPDEVYRASPSLREYRYIERDNRTYVVVPHEQTIIEFQSQRYDGVAAHSHSAANAWSFRESPSLCHTSTSASQSASISESSW